MGLPHWDLWVAAIGIVGVLLAIVLRFTFARKRRASDHPSCRKCGHDLFGLPETSTRCPECGTDLTAKRAVLPHTQTIPTKRRWIVRAIMLIALVLTLWAGWSVIHNPAYTKHKPSLVLIYITERFISDPSAPLELYGRLERGDLDRLSLWWIRHRAVRWVTNWHATGIPAIGARLTFVPALHRFGAIDDQTFVRWMNDLLVTEFVSLRDSEDGEVTGLSAGATYLGSHLHPIEISIRETRINGNPVDIDWLPLWDRGSKFVWRLGGRGPTLTPGDHTVEIVVDIETTSDPMASKGIPLRTNHTLSTTITIPDPATTPPAATP